MKLSRFIAAVLTMTLILSVAEVFARPTAFGEEETNTMTAMELAKEMKLGWSLGNTFDAPLGETAWGNPRTTRELIEKVKELGFGTIRIPVSWGKHVSAAPEYTIEPEFLNRVDTVVQDALEAGLYVIINTHHDNELYTPTVENKERAKAYLSAVWSQIGSHFADAPYTLIFETMNEPRVAGSSFEWNINLNHPDCVASLEVVNELNQTALDAIRASGGRNADRFVMVTPYVASPTAAAAIFQLPEDSVPDKLLVSLHSYIPYSFALDIHSKDADFGRRDENEIKSMLKSVNYRFVKKGIPVVMGEMGCLNKNNPEDRYAWAKFYVSCAQEYGIPCIWWDNGQINGSGENFGLIDRRELSVYEQSERVYRGLMDGLLSE